MLYTFLDWGFIYHGYPKFYSKGGKVIGIKNNIEKLLNIQNSKMLFYWPPPYINNPPTEFDAKIQSNYDRFLYVIGKERDIEIKDNGKTILIPFIKKTCQSCKTYNEIKAIQCRQCNAPIKTRTTKQKEVDVQMATDMLMLYYANKMTGLFLISGDQDFVPVLRFLSDKIDVYTLKGHHVASPFKNYAKKQFFAKEVHSFLD